MFNNNITQAGGADNCINPRRRIINQETDLRLAPEDSAYSVSKFAIDFASTEVAKNFHYVQEHCEWLERDSSDRTKWKPETNLLKEIGIFLNAQLKTKPRSRNWDDPNHLWPKQRQYIKTVPFKKRIKYELEYMEPFFIGIPYLELKLLLGREPLVLNWNNGSPTVSVRKIDEWHYFIKCPFCYQMHKHGRGAGGRCPHCCLNAFGEYGHRNMSDYIIAEPDPEMLKDAPPDYWQQRLAAKAKRAA